MRSLAVVFPKVGIFNAKTTVFLIAVSNIAFAAHYALWKYGVIHHPEVGIDPFAGAVALWFLVLVVLAGLEIVAIVCSLNRAQRNTANSSLAAIMWLLQIFTIRFLYLMLEGV